MAERETPDRRTERMVRVAVERDALGAGTIWRQLADAGINSLVRPRPAPNGRPALRLRDAFAREPDGAADVVYRYEVFVPESEVGRATRVLGGEVKLLPRPSAVPALPAGVSGGRPRHRGQRRARALPIVIPAALTALVLTGMAAVVLRPVERGTPAPPAARVASVAAAAPRALTAEAGQQPGSSPPAPAAGQPAPPADRRAAVAVQAIAPAYVVNALPLGCHPEPSAEAPLLFTAAPGTVHLTTALARRPDGAWHRTAEAQCWLHVNPAHVAEFASPERAECFAVAFRRPRPLVAHCVEIVSVIGSIARGESGSLLAQAPPGAICTSNILTLTASAFQVQELEPQSADAKGWVHWRWDARPTPRPGTSTITVSCDPGGLASISEGGG